MSLFMYSPQPKKQRAPLTFRWDVKCLDCYGRGWFTVESYEEMYCSCEAAKWRRIYDGAEP